VNLSKEELSASIGDVIRELRLAEKKSIESLSNETGIGYSQLSRIERGKINTTIYQIYVILSALNVPMNTLLKVLVYAVVKQNKKPKKNKK
jgi:transcriptional regulator with XRE-family HTH domain